MYNFIMMKCGYVENNQVAWLMFGCQFFGISGFATMEEAIKVLAEDLYNKCKDDASEDSVWQRQEELSLLDFQERICNLHNTTCDTYGEAEQTKDRHLSWWPFWAANFPEAVKNGSVIWIGENAEHILLQALLEAKPELQSEEYEDESYSTDWEQFKVGKQPVIC
jgi:hypothetical protein